MPRGRGVQTRRSGRLSTIANTLAAAAGRSPPTRGRGVRAIATGRGRGADRGRGASRGADRGGPSRPGATTSTAPQATTPPTPTYSDEDVETDSGYLLGLVREAVQQVRAESGHISLTGSDDTPSSGIFHNLHSSWVCTVFLCPIHCFR